MEKMDETVLGTERHNIFPASSILAANNRAARTMGISCGLCFINGIKGNSPLRAETFCILAGLIVKNLIFAVSAAVKHLFLPLPAC
jgi:hypothetical protein